MNIYRSPRNWLIIPMLLIVALAVHADFTPVQELRNLLQPIDSLQANFQQTVVGSKNKIIQEASGYMEFKQPNLFRWQIDQPDASLIVTDGKKLWNYDESLAQVVVQKYATSDEVTPVSFLFDGVDKLNKNFMVTKLNNKNSMQKCFNLTPKQDNPNFVSVEVCFVKDQISELRLADHLSQLSTFKFSKVKNNPKIELSKFKFTAPQGVDVVGEE